MHGLRWVSQPSRGRGGGTPANPLAAARVGVSEALLLEVMMILFIIDRITV